MSFKLPESYTSLILGAIVVLVVGILFIFLAKGNKNEQTGSVGDSAKTEQNQNSNTSSTYTIKPGDDLWSISENVYKNGYRWIEIAKINKLENPGLIHVGNKLTIPTVMPTVTQKTQQSLETQNSIAQNNSITGTTYTIKSGDNLWDIAVRAYEDGFKWPEIAKANNIPNPNLIYPDNVLNLP